MTDPTIAECIKIRDDIMTWDTMNQIDANCYVNSC